MTIKNTVEKANSMRGMINPHYNMTIVNATEIHDVYGGNFESICCSFRFGYLQGVKAAKAEMRKKELN